MLKAEMEWVKEVARSIAKEEVAKAIAKLSPPAVEKPKSLKVEPEVAQPVKKTKVF